jgi:hypothetical protein
MTSLSRAERITLTLSAVFTALAAAQHFMHAGPMLAFVASATVLSMLAVVVGRGRSRSEADSALVRPVSSSPRSETCPGCSYASSAFALDSWTS